MRFYEYFKDKIIRFMIALFVYVISFMLLYISGSNIVVLSFVAVIVFLLAASFTVYDYYKRKRYYRDILISIENLDKKHLISELISPSSFIDSVILCELLALTNKSMNDEIAKYKISEEQYREYIEMWVHEIKTPISSSLLIIENNRSEVTLKLLEDMERIEGYVEQALFYSRSNNVEKDYIIKEISLSHTVKNVIKKHSKQLIGHAFSVNLHDLDHTVFCDSKWTEFIISQIISNALKYKGNCKQLEIFGEAKKDSIVLAIRDNGAGIPATDIGRVFNKGFTGVNGRKFGKSTGMGLYLCKKMCDKLGLSITLESEENDHTTVMITFPKAKLKELL